MTAIRRAIALGLAGLTLTILVLVGGAAARAQGPAAPSASPPAAEQ